eukprot:TRINITY_DN12293_c1_g2_i2.p1 TRINITY_DN12293_c1_g2~~TRINITY_DN12293_c1_g2_i2.p1  ORF type:complete len:130 (+),score=10.91 TRINITY_DN12293_c1_g2_i2:61-450(+)
MAEGFHEVKYDEGDKYRGMWNADGKRHGLGVLEFVDGSKYAGEFSAGMNSGYGVLTFLDKSQYSGQFVDGKYQGYGVFKKSDGMTYEGQFEDGKVRSTELRSPIGVLLFGPVGRNGSSQQFQSWACVLH